MTAVSLTDFGTRRKGGEMAKYRHQLPQLSERMFLTDGGLETTLIFHRGLGLPEFAAFVLLNEANGVAELTQYYRQYASIATKYGTGFILESATWRANPDWGKKLGYSAEGLARANRQAIEIFAEVRADFESEKTPIVISGCLGPRGDGYVPSNAMTADEAEQYHAEQIGIFSQTEADLVTAITMNYVEEALGIARAASSFKMPVAISLTVETDGKLPAGQTLKDAIETVDQETGSYPAYYMINCAHPTHFEEVLDGGSWTGRIRGLRANSSTKSHQELNESTELDEGDPVELGRQHQRLRAKLPNVNIFGGCCGTDHRHVEEICKAIL
jgi:S-methylmethionine-dependent homocysteine/selenocysteine methylase